MDESAALDCMPSDELLSLRTIPYTTNKKYDFLSQSY